MLFYSGDSVDDAFGDSSDDAPTLLIPDNTSDGRSSSRVHDICPYLWDLRCPRYHFTYSSDCESHFLVVGYRPDTLVLLF